jgi:hypothetical protein
MNRCNAYLNFVAPDIFLKPAFTSQLMPTRTTRSTPAASAATPNPPTRHRITAITTSTMGHSRRHQAGGVQTLALLTFDGRIGLGHRSQGIKLLPTIRTSIFVNRHLQSS